MKKILVFFLPVIAGNFVFSQKTDSAKFYLKKGMHEKAARINYAAGKIYSNRNEYRSAVPYYKKAVELGTCNDGWAYELGLLYYYLNDFKKATVYFSKAGAAGYPQNIEFLENLGYACIYSGELKEGERFLSSVFAARPGNKGVLKDVADVYYRLKNI